MKIFQKNKYTTLLLVLAAEIVVTGLLIGYKNYSKGQQQRTKGKAVVKQVLVRRSKIPEIITKATTAKAIDVNTGKVITAARIFSVNDKTVYLSLDLDNPKIGTRIDYIRYLYGRYVDHGSVKISKLQTSNLAFSWIVTKPLGSRQDGQYKVATYYNGILEKRVSYVITKEKLTSSAVEQEINPNDPNYRLDLALLSHD